MKKANIFYSIVAIVSLALAIVLGASVIECILAVGVIGVAWRFDCFELKGKERKSEEKKVLG